MRLVKPDESKHTRERRHAKEAYKATVPDECVMCSRMRRSCGTFVHNSSVGHL